MVEGSKNSWWRRTCFLAFAILIIGFVATIVSVIYAMALQGDGARGIESGMFAVTLVIPTFILLLIFWSAERQQKIDRAFGPIED